MEAGIAPEEKEEAQISLISTCPALADALAHPSRFLELDLSTKQLTFLPAEIGSLTALTTLNLYGNESTLTTPPFEICAQGTAAIAAD